MHPDLINALIAMRIADLQREADLYRLARAAMPERASRRRRLTARRWLPRSVPSPDLRPRRRRRGATGKGSSRVLSQHSNPTTEGAVS